MRCRLRWAAAALAIAATVPLAAPATAEEVCEGVLVVIDPGQPEPVRTGCAPRAPNSGETALRNAGFKFSIFAQGDRHYCRIDGLPADGVDCQGARPTDRYWSYWYADDGRWLRSDTLAILREPDLGGVEGWAYGPGRPPRLAPGEAGAVTEPDLSSDVSLVDGLVELWWFWLLVLFVIFACGWATGRLPGGGGGGDGDDGGDGGGDGGGGGD